jgi:hypothetical protein
MVVPLGIGPTMNARTDGPMDTVANDAWAGTSSGIAMVCTPVGSSSSSITREVLFGSGGERSVPPGDPQQTSPNSLPARSGLVHDRHGGLA